VTPRLRPSEALEKHRAEVRAIIAKYPVADAGVFGSVARGEDTEDSDLDLIVERRGVLSLLDLARLEIELEELLGVPVGVHTPDEFRPPAGERITRERLKL
jgi:predicted nucleotidyltransferase